MSEDNRNALAEMAEFLKEESKVPKSEEFKARAIASVGEDGWKRYLAKKNKLLTASRIIAELAPVKFRKRFELEPIDEPDIVECCEAVANCRAIAEKGAENE